MSLAFRNEIDITVWLAGGTIADVAIQPRSRPPLTRLFAGKQASSLLTVLPRLFSLCSVAHQVAFLLAIEAAQGRRATPAAARQRSTALVAERLTELLRSLFIGQLALDVSSAAAVRAITQATIILSGSEGVTEALRCEAVAGIKDALAVLGIDVENRAVEPDSALAAHIERCKGEGLAPALAEQSFLTAADDLAVVMRLVAGGADYSDAPELCGKVPETGVWARCARRETALLVAGPAARFEARIAEIARLCAWLDHDAENLDDDLVASYQLGVGKAAAAVECARGRLYHAVELDDQEHIVNFEFLAPTEWNFHARGPLVRSLKGADLAAGRRGQDAVRTLISSFDPCVGFKLDFRELGHA